MSSKIFIGIIVILVGLGIIGYAIHSMQRIAKAKSDIDFFTSPFSDKPGGKEIHGALYGKASQYDLPVLILLIGGIAVTVAGGFIVYRYRKK